MDALEQAWRDSHLRYNIVNALEKIIASRRDSIKMLEDRMSEYTAQAAALPAGSAARKAVQALVDVDRARKGRLELELAGLLEAVKDDRQGELGVPPKKR